MQTFLLENVINARVVLFGDLVLMIYSCFVEVTCYPGGAAADIE